MYLQGQIEVGRELAQLLERLEEPGPIELDRVRVEEDRGQVALLVGELDRLAPEQPAELGLGTDALGDPEELEGALGQPGVSASAERFVGGYRPREAGR